MSEFFLFSSEILEKRRNSQEMSAEVEEVGRKENAVKFVNSLHEIFSTEPQDVLRKAIELAPRVIAATSDSDKEVMIQHLIKTTGCTRLKATKTLGTVASLSDLVIRLKGKQDSIENVINQTLEIVPTVKEKFTQSQINLLYEVLATLRSEVETLERSAEAGRVARGFLPMYSDLQATVELRSNRSVFEGDENEKINFTPIASIRLDFDFGLPDFVCFQATESDLELMLEKLQKIVQELNLIRNIVS